MEKEKFALLNEDELEGISGGTDVGHINCTEFVCWFCGYTKAYPGESLHDCTFAGGSKMTHRCNDCVHAGSCSRAMDYQNM